MFAWNAWYAIAWEHELPDAGVLARTVLGGVPAAARD